MAELSNLRSAVIEKQEIILNKLTSLSFEEVMHLMASLSSLITNLDKIQAEEEMHCNRIIVREMEKDQRTTFSKAEAILKASETYQSYKNVMGLKQFAIRGLTFTKMQAQYILKSNHENDTENES